MADETQPRRTAVGATFDNFHDRRAAPKAPVDDFPPLSDEEYGEMEDNYNARQQNGANLAKKVGDMKRQAHTPTPKAKLPMSSMAKAKKFNSLARKARGRR